MRTMITVMMAASILAIAAAAAAEEESGNSQSMQSGAEVDTSFEVTQAKLYADGFREINMINGSSYWLSAFDAQGSQVRLLIDPQTGEVDQTVYEHSMDK